jgi:cell division protein ZapA (FtsZ GTPase activity inhibitor)
MADSEGTKNINVLIAGRTYPVRVLPEEESELRGIVQEVNDKIKEFQMTYTNRDKQDCLAMALLTYAVDAKNKAFHTPQKEWEALDKAKEIELLMDRVLG